MIAVKSVTLCCCFRSSLLRNKNEQNNKKVTLYSILKSSYTPNCCFPSHIECLPFYSQHYFNQRQIKQRPLCLQRGSRTKNENAKAWGKDIRPDFWYLVGPFFYDAASLFVINNWNCKLLDRCQQHFVKTRLFKKVPNCRVQCSVKRFSSSPL